MSSKTLSVVFKNICQERDRSSHFSADTDLETTFQFGMNQDPTVLGSVAYQYWPFNDGARHMCEYYFKIAQTVPKIF